MHRTTIMLPEALKTRAVDAARAEKVSLGEFIRRAVEDRIEKPPEDWSDDPFFRDTRVYDGPGPDDLVARHDDYLYGDEP